MACDINDIIHDANLWEQFSPNQVMAMQIILMCDALNGIDPRVTVGDPKTLVTRINCLSAGCLSGKRLMGAYIIMMTQWWASMLSTGGLGSGAVRQYATDPNVEGVVPLDQDSPAVAYQQDGAGPIYTWNTTTHVWQ